jgi:hypothetical protein
MESSTDDEGEQQKPSLPPESAPDSIPVSLRGFADAAHAERFGHKIANTVRALSRYIDVERLDGITVAFDYDNALAELDRGYEASRALTRTNDDGLVGVAMTPAVMRNGVVKAHLVFYAPMVLPLEDTEDAKFRQAAYLVAHECGHIEDLKRRDERFPGNILQRRITDYEEGIIEQFVDSLWDEYAACRVSAIFGEDQTPVYEESLVSVATGARDRANAAIRDYRLHGDIHRVLGEAGQPLWQPLRLAAYLYGHLDGLGLDMTAVPRAQALLSESPFTESVYRVRDALRHLWSRRDEWVSLSEFDALREIGRDSLADGGIILRRIQDGQLYVDVPFSPETMP